VSAVPQAAEAALKSVEQAWATTGFEAKSTPVMVAGTAVLYGSVGTDLFIIGIDPATGAERWRRQVSVTAFSPDQEITVDKLDDKVAYLRPVADVNSQIVVIDPATGTGLFASEPQWWVRLAADLR
jgi:outer membrane protein assembly factor BamB